MASRSIRLDINRKLAKLGMPYLWDPSHSTAQLEDVVTKDPGQFQLFARLPLMLSSAAFSLGAVLYAKPVRGGGHVCVGEPNGVAELSRRIDGRCLGAVPGGVRGGGVAHGVADHHADRVRVPRGLPLREGALRLGHPAGLRRPHPRAQRLDAQVSGPVSRAQGY